MDAVHTVRHKRYTVNRDTASGAGYYWQDHTVSLAAAIFNGHSKSIGHYAHTARMVYDKHWHGRNRVKKKHLSQEELDATVGVMTQLYLDTKDGTSNVIGLYWLNKHSAGDTSDHNLWRCLRRYVL